MELKEFIKRVENVEKNADKVLKAARLDKLAKPLVEYLKENCHPHTVIVITAERAEAVETVLSIMQDEKGLESIDKFIEGFIQGK